MSTMKWIIGAALLTVSAGALAGETAGTYMTFVRSVTESQLPDGFDYDPIVFLHLLDAHARIEEIPIPTHYGDEISRVRLGRDGTRILLGALRHWWKTRLPTWPLRAGDG